MVAGLGETRDCQGLACLPPTRETASGTACLRSDMVGTHVIANRQQQACKPEDRLGTTYLRSDMPSPMSLRTGAAGEAISNRISKIGPVRIHIIDQIEFLLP